MASNVNSFIHFVRFGWEMASNFNSLIQSVRVVGWVGGAK